MTKRYPILFLFLFAVLTGNVFSQSSASATMDVSVRVVSGVNIEAAQPNLVMLRSEKKSSLGMLTLKGIDNDGSVLISNSDQIILNDSKGHQITLDVFSRSEQKEKNHRNIQFEAKSKGEMISSTYRGELSTTIEYF